MRLLIAALFASALIWAVPTETPVNKVVNSTQVQAVRANLPPKEIQDNSQEKALKSQTQTTTGVVSNQEEVPASTPQTVPNTPDEWMNIVGLTESEKEAARYIIGQESGWCPTKWQGQYGSCPDYHGVPQGEVGYGLCQSTPAHKMAEAGDDWATNPITQLKWCHQYVQAYGGWVKAAEFKRCTGWCYSTRILATTFKHTPWL